MNSHLTTDINEQLRRWAKELGFADCRISDGQLEDYEPRLAAWLEAGYHGEMDYMARHGTKRSRPAELLPGTVRVISVRMDYLPGKAADMDSNLGDSSRAYVSRYALGRDYHKMMRKRLKQLALKVESEIGPMGFRVFVDSAPVLEKALAERAGLGWIGKHSNLINRRAGSWFFLGEIYTDMPLTPDHTPQRNHCGDCTACIQACPTQAIVGTNQVDARRCISYLTIELRDAIPLELRPLMGNRIYGCDDCQLVCPWNRFSEHTEEDDFQPRHGLDQATLVALFRWTEDEFLARTEGSAIRRIGYRCWLRNIAVALGNADADAATLQVLKARADHPDEMVREHVQWAIEQHNLNC